MSEFKAGWFGKMPTEPEYLRSGCAVGQFLESWLTVSEPDLQPGQTVLFFHSKPSLLICGFVQHSEDSVGRRAYLSVAMPVPLDLPELDQILQAMKNLATHIAQVTQLTRESCAELWTTVRATLHSRPEAIAEFFPDEPDYQLARLIHRGRSWLRQTPPGETVALGVQAASAIIAGCLALGLASVQLATEEWTLLMSSDELLVSQGLPAGPSLTEPTFGGIPGEAPPEDAGLDFLDSLSTAKKVLM